MQAIINGEMYEVEPAVKVIVDKLMIEIAELKAENARLEESFQRATGAVAADALPTFAEMRKVSEMCRTTKCKQCGYFDKKEHHCRFDDGADHWDFGGADDDSM
jgi:hypothetical protein